MLGGSESCSGMLSRGLKVWIFYWMLCFILSFFDLREDKNKESDFLCCFFYVEFIW